MSERFKATLNVNDSKNTRLPIGEEFANYRFGRDALAHVSRYLWICEQLVKQAKKRGRPLQILDVGCGDVYVARVLQASMRVPKKDVVERYVGFDLDDRSLTRTAKTMPRSFAIDLVCGDVTTRDLEQFEEGEFDVLVCTEVLEHIKPEFVPMVLRTFSALAPLAFISTPNFAGGSGRLPKDHVQEWDAEDLAVELERAGYRIVLEIGTFCQLKNAEALAQADPFVANVFEELKGKLDRHLLSLVMARFLGRAAQNVLYVCEAA